MQLSGKLQASSAGSARSHAAKPDHTLLQRSVRSRNVLRRPSPVLTTPRVAAETRATAGASVNSSSVQPQLKDPEFESFLGGVKSGANLIPICRRIFSDQLTPVLGYRCLVKDNDTDAPSFLLESVVNGDTSGRYSFVGAMPAMEILATKGKTTVLNHITGERTVTEEEDPMMIPERMCRAWKPATVPELPRGVFTGGFVGYAGYDTVRYVYSGKLPFAAAPTDDRNLPDMQLALYNDVVVFDQATKIMYIVSWVHVDEQAASDMSALRAAYEDGKSRASHLVHLLSDAEKPQMSSGNNISMSLSERPASPGQSNMTKEEFLACVDRTKGHIQAGDVFQLVLSQRFERRSFATPFEIYRALRVVNPSPYMVYMQTRGCVIVSSSPEILCKVDESGIVTNRPLAGTRARGKTPEQDLALEEELLADGKECSEHVMLVDLGRNDVGKVAAHGSVKVEKLMVVERYSHVMHISSTVTGKLREDYDRWDALRAALPAGTVSGAPKVRAMQIIDELEVNKRGPYGGGVGCVSFTGGMDMALGLRTIVVQTAIDDARYSYKRANGSNPPRREWVVHLQSGAGLVADSVPESEYEETVNKAAALGRAVDLAEKAFVQ